MSSRRLVLATRNAGKVRDLTTLLAGLPLHLSSLTDHPEVSDVEESAGTYRENAEAKAMAVVAALGLPALADDSGLEVDALGGEPGVHSARFSGGGAAENIALLLARLSRVPAERRTARFRCVIVVARPGGRTLTAEGTCDGTIANAPSGDGGFGYDPVFTDPATHLTFAQLPAARKNRISHRARAGAALRPRLVDFLTGP